MVPAASLAAQRSGSISASVAPVAAVVGDAPPVVEVAAAAPVVVVSAGAAVVAVVSPEASSSLSPHAAAIRRAHTTRATSTRGRRIGVTQAGPRPESQTG